MKTFGETLYAWLDYLDLGVTEFAIICGKHPNYIGSLKRGKNKGGAAGIGRPTLRVQEQIFEGLNRAILKQLGRVLKMNSEMFYKGPPIPSELPERATASNDEQRSTAPHVRGIDIAAVLESPNVTFNEYTLSDAQKKQALAFLSAITSTRQS